MFKIRRGNASSAVALRTRMKPARTTSSIAVTATDANDQLFAMASRGRHVAIAAPGVDILAPAPDNRIVLSSGTSFASAYVSGVAALLAERKPDITPDAIKNVLMYTAHHLGPPPRNDQFGAGLVDANEALVSVSSPAGAGVSQGTATTTWRDATTNSSTGTTAAWRDASIIIASASPSCATRTAPSTWPHAAITTPTSFSSTGGNGWRTTWHRHSAARRAALCPG